MLKHYLKISIRSFSKSKTTFIINLVGLSAGLISSLLILFWVQSEFSVDTFHRDNDRIFRAMEHQHYTQGEIFTTRSTPGILAPELKKVIPEIEFASTSSWTIQHMLKKGNSNLMFEGLYVDNDYLSIFSFDLLEGNPNTLLEDLSSIVITEKVAKALFGDQSALGNSIILDNDQSYKVTGVLADLPINSSIQFDYLLSAQKWRNENEWLTSWGSNGPSTYVKIRENTDYSQINDKILNFIREREEGVISDLFLYPFTDSYLYGPFKNGVQSGGRIEYVRLFSVIAVFVILIACINFMNLSTAKATRRAKEVGIRKTLGAYRSTLIVQFLFESFIITGLAIGLSVTIIPLILPFFNEITGKELTFNLNPALLLNLLIFWLITAFISGSYPALYLSHFQPTAVLKNEIKNSWGELWARRGLVIFQFTLSIFLIISVAIVYSQIQFVLKKDIGYNKENLVYFWLEGKLARENKQPFLDELEKIPGVIGTSLSAHSFSGRNSNITSLDWPGKEEGEVILFEFFRGNEKLISNMGIKIVQGRDFSQSMSTDDSLSIIFNQKAISMMNLENAVGTTVNLFGTNMKIIGVVEDFHFESLHDEVSPAFFIISDEVWLAQARLSGEAINETLIEMEKVHSDFNPGFIFDYKFQDKTYEEMYTSERRVASISQYFAGFAILISCLGLYGLASHTAERRAKEIGIRKVLGASVKSLIFLLSKEFARLVFAAILVSIPLSWWVAKRYLEDFAYHIDLNIFYFIGAGLLALIIAMISVSSQAYNAATMNPVETLKDE